VDVRFLVNEVPHVVRRRSADGSVAIKVGADEFRDCSEDEVRTLLPIQAYSQKQLSDVSVRTSELARFVTSPVRGRLREVRTRIDDHAAKVRQTYATRLRLRSLTAEIARRNLEQRSLKEQTDAVRATLTDLSDDDRALLAQGESYDAADAAVEAWLGNLSSLQEATAELQQTVSRNLAAAPAPAETPHGEVLKAASDEHAAILREAERLLGELAAKAGEAVSAADDPHAETPFAKWKKEAGGFRAAYDAAVRRSSAQQQKIEQLQELEKRLAAHVRQTRALEEELRTLTTAEGRYNEQRDAWRAALREHGAVLEGQCEALTRTAGGAIRASVRRFANPQRFVERLRDSLSGSNIRRDKLDALGQSIVESANPERLWKDINDDLEKLAEFNPEREGADHRPATPALSGAGLTAGDLNRIATRLSTDDWLALSLEEIGSEPVFEYKSREGDYIEFENASAGQQATALLKALLNQPGPPLIVDQPEEDLDNPVMPEIVAQLWSAKATRQIIFASHNANLVVNGDAELVVWCDYRKAGDQSLGKIAGEGAIDVPHVRDAIKSIMEGGERAFQLRKEKYGF